MPVIEFAKISLDQIILANLDLNERLLLQISFKEYVFAKF